MNGTYRVIMYISICAFAATLIGCEPQEPAGERQERLYATENIELKKQIADMEKQLEKELQAKQKELDTCIEERTSLEKYIQEDTAKIMEDSLTDSLIEQLQEMTKQNIKLTAQVEELEQKLESSQEE